MSGSDIRGLKSELVKSVATFKSDNEKYGFNQIQVNKFLDELIKMVDSYDASGDYGSIQSNTSGNAAGFMDEYNREASQLVSRINDVKFNQMFRGYYTAEVDDLLDTIIRAIRKHGSYELVNQPMETIAIENAKPSKIFRGYMPEEVDAFLKKVCTAIEELNEIKNKYR